MKKFFVLGLSLLILPAAAFAADTTAPSITLVGGSVNIAEGTTYVEPGYSATDDTDGDITSSVAVSGISFSLGTHLFAYNVSDAAGNAAASKTRSVSFYANSLASPCIVNGTCPCPISADPIAGDRAAWKSCVMQRYPKLTDGSTRVCRLTPVGIGESPKCAAEQNSFWNMFISPTGVETYQ